MALILVIATLIDGSHVIDHCEDDCHDHIALEAASGAQPEVVNINSEAIPLPEGFGDVPVHHDGCHQHLSFIYKAISTQLSVEPLFSKIDFVNQLDSDPHPLGVFQPPRSHLLG
jgi:hypothetical protein